MGYSIQPEDKTLPSSQGAQIPVGLQKDFLRYILSVLEVEKPGIDVGIDASLVFVHKQAEGSWLSVKTPVNYTPIFCPQFVALL
jgi:hypothetical protein